MTEKSRSNNDVKATNLWKLIELRLTSLNKESLVQKSNKHTKTAEQDQKNVPQDSFIPGNKL